MAPPVGKTRVRPQFPLNGNAYLSWAFVEAVHHAIRHCPAAKRFYDRKAAQRNGALATKALAAKWTKGRSQGSGFGYWGRSKGSGFGYWCP